MFRFLISVVFGPECAYPQAAASSIEAALAEAQLDRLVDALKRIAVGPRSDGSYDLSREACTQIASEALTG